MDDDGQPAFTIKKRTKSRPSSGVVRSTSTSSLNSPSKLSFTGDDAETAEGDEEGAGNVAVIRNRGKRTPAGRVREREGGGAAKGKSRLSFGSTAGDEDDDDSASSAVKRSTPSSTPRRLLRAALPPSSSSASISSAAGGGEATAASPVTSAAAGMYSKEYLDSLKSEQRATPRTLGEEEEGAVQPAGYDSLTMSKFGEAQSQDGTFSFPSSPKIQAAIPTTDAIARAKARREEMRKAGLSAPAKKGQDDYVSLDVGFANKGGDSRLVREEDELGDGDEDLAAYTDSLSTLPIGKKANAAAALRLKQEIGDMIDDVAMDVEEDDEEQRAWENAQVRRAGGGGERTQGRRREPEAGGKKPYRAAPIPQSAPLPSLSSALSRLTASLSALQASHTSSTAALVHFERERADLDRQEAELREEVEKVERKSEWFEGMKGEVEDWGAFLEEKFPALESIEQTSLSLLRERYSILAARRYQDSSDDVALFTGQPVPSRWPPRFLPADGDEAMQEDPLESEAAEEERAANEPRSALRAARRAEREERLASLSSSSAGRASSTALDSPDALPPSSSSDLTSAVSDLRASLAALFSDVKAPAFRDPNLGIRQRFEEWRQRFREEYEMTFAGLGMVQVWEFWARVELVGGWNPLEIEELPRSPADLSSYAWHQALSSYGHSPSSGDASPEPEGDESTELINSLVASVVIPRLSAIARAGYDPYSEKQTRAALKWVDEVSYCVEPSSPKFESLILTFLHRLRLSVAALQTLLLPFLSSLSLPSLAYDPATFLSRTRFLETHLALVRNAGKWRRYMRALRVPAVPVEVKKEDGDGEGLLEVGGGGTFDELVQRELVAKTLLPVVEAAWGTGGEAVAQKILEALPKDIPPALRRRLEGEQVQR
ncbi:hypothetical protein JCM8097_009000 [Rhodosporidiobolus ruineniae]